MNTHMKHHSMLLCLVDPNGLRSNSKISQMIKYQIPKQTNEKIETQKQKLKKKHTQNKNEHIGCVTVRINQKTTNDMPFQ